MTNTKKITQYLAISLLGSDSSGIIHEVSKYAAHCNCNIVEGRITTLGSEVMASFLLAGTWNALAKFEAGLPSFEKKHDLRTLTRRTQPFSSQPDRLPYMIYIMAMEEAGVFHKIIQFFDDQKTVSIHELTINSYLAPYSKVPMLTINLAITFPKTKLIADFRESLMVFCDDHNFDVVLEPQKI